MHKQNRLAETVPMSQETMNSIQGGSQQRSAIFMGSDFGTTPGYNDGNGHDWGNPDWNGEPAPLAPAFPIFILCGTCI